MTAIREARCACGQLSARCEGEPLKVSLCHCTDCKLRTGSAFGISVFYSKEMVTPAGESRTFSRLGDSGLPLEFHFCPDCGSTVYWYPARAPDRVGVALGAFGESDVPAPGQAVYTDRALSWAEHIPDGETQQ